MLCFKRFDNLFASLDTNLQLNGIDLVLNNTESGKRLFLNFYVMRT